MSRFSSNAALIQEFFKDLGGNPEEIAIHPSDDDLAPGYRVIKEGKRVIITRLDIQDRNVPQIKRILKKLF